MTKEQIYNTLKTTQLNYAITASVLAIECGSLTGEDLTRAKNSAKEAHSSSNALLGAINDLLGNDYQGHRVMNAQNELLLERWSELEKGRLGL